MNPTAGADAGEVRKRRVSVRWTKAEMPHAAALKESWLAKNRYRGNAKVSDATYFRSGKGLHWSSEDIAEVTSQYFDKMP